MTNDQQLHADLQALFVLFSNPNNWGRATWRYPKEQADDGFCYCLGGGIAKVIGTVEFTSQYMMLEPRAQYLRKALGFETTGEMVNWNDSAVTTYASLVDRITKALRRFTPKGDPKPKRKYTRKSK